MNNPNGFKFNINPYSFNYETGKGLSVKINEDELTELMEEREEKRLEDLEYKEECKNEREDWDCCETDYL